MIYVCAANEQRALNYCKSHRVAECDLVLEPEDVPELESGDTVVVVGTLTPETKKALWDAWREVDGVHKRWEK